MQPPALAAAGEAGVQRLLELLEVEIRAVMGLMGVTSLKELNPSYVKPSLVVSSGKVTGPFPWFEEQSGI